MHIGLAHDYLTQRGGAERVALVLAQAFGSPIHTSVYEPAQTYPEFRALDVRTSPLGRVRLVRRDPRLALPLLPWAFSRLEVADADVVLTSSTGFAHGVATDAPKVVYCHNPPRWLYQADDYLKGQPAAVRGVLAALRPALLRWDQRAARSASRYLVNSTVVRERVRRAYGIDAQVVHPPVGIDPSGARRPVDGIEPGYFLAVGRPRGYKHIELLCAAFSDLPDARLVVVGGLPQGEWPDRFRGLTGVSDAELRWLYANCEATVAVSHEDFGLTPLEGNAFGRPALCLRAGGYLDTLDEGVSGWFIERADHESVRAAVLKLHEDPVSVRGVLQHAERFSVAAFRSTVQAVLTEVAQGGGSAA